MIAKQITLTILASLAAAGAWCQFTSPARASACGEDFLPDADGDFLPDEVEWVVLTNPNSDDTDSDNIGDFIEVVQRASPRLPGTTRPLDHEMRVVVTSPASGSATQPTWLHLFVLVHGQAALVSQFRAWLALPGLAGVQIPLDLASFPSMVFEQRQTTHDGLWIQISVPLVSERALQAILPCSIHASMTIGGRTIHSAVPLFEMQGSVCSLVPFSQTRVAMQTIGPVAMSASSSNKVCLLELVEVGSGPGGQVVEVMDADCEDCNELECGAGCPQSVGWVITIEGGIQGITGG